MEAAAAASTGPEAEPGLGEAGRDSKPPALDEEASPVTGRRFTRAT
jgi:hypothetical protein